jgi:integrase
MSQRGLGRIYRRGAGGWFWLQVSYQGRQYRKPAKTQDENEARTALGKWLAEVSAGMFVPEARAVMFGDLERLALENYAAEQRKSAHTLKNCLCNLREVFGSMRALDITTPRLAAYVARRRKEHAAASTIKKELNAMSLALRCAREAYGGAFVHRPEFPRVSIPKSARRRGFFEPEQLERVLAHLPDVYVPVIRFLAATGWRFGEAVGLEWRNVDERAGIIRIEDTKSDEPRTLPYAANALLVGLIRSRREATRTIERRTRRLVRHVFANAEGHSLRTGFHDAWEKARKAAGLPSALIHDLRRTFARDCVRAGLAEATIMKLAGWETASVFRRYAIVNESDLAEATRRLAASRGVRVPDVYPNSGDDGEQAGQAVAVSGCNAPLASDTEDTAVHVNAFEVPGDHQIPFVPAPSQPPVVAQGSTEQPSAAETPEFATCARPCTRTHRPRRRS